MNSEPTCVSHFTCLQSLQCNEYCKLLMPKGKNIAISELRALSTGCCQSFGDGDMERRLHKHVNTPQYNQQGFLEDLLKNIALM